MRIALWTAQPSGWPAALAAQAIPAAEVVLVGQAVSVRADLHAYHVTASASCGFVYRALLRDPGLVVLEDWNLHELVYAETAGRGDSTAYRREARRERGPSGSFIAEQVLRGLGGALTDLLPLNARVLEASLGVVATAEEVARRARRSRPERPVVQLPLGQGDPREQAKALVAFARQLAPGLPEARRALAASHAQETTAYGRALAELHPFARELGLEEVPGLRASVASVFPPARRSFAPGRAQNERGRGAPVRRTSLRPRSS